MCAGRVFASRIAPSDSPRRCDIASPRLRQAESVRIQPRATAGSGVKKGPVRKGPVLFLYPMCAGRVFASRIAPSDSPRRCDIASPRLRQAESVRIQPRATAGSGVKKGPVRKGPVLFLYPMCAGRVFASRIAPSDSPRRCDIASPRLRQAESVRIQPRATAGSGVKKGPVRKGPVLFLFSFIGGCGGGTDALTRVSKNRF